MNKKILCGPAALLLLLAACGGGVDTGDDVVTTQTTVADMAGMADMDEMADEHGDDHDHGTTREWVGAPPEITVTVTESGDGGWDVVAEISDFTFTDADTMTHVDGEGHVHLIVDGRELAMSYEPTMRIDQLEPGEHTIGVSLSSNDHAGYVIDGETIAGGTSIVVEGQVSDADAIIEITVEGGQVTGGPERHTVALGSIVELHVSSDTEDEVHVHGYDVFGEAGGTAPTVLRFTADIPGVFEVELEQAHTLIAELEVS